MFTKKERLSRKDFVEVFKTSRVIARGSFFMLKKQDTQAGEFSCAAVVSKKVAKKAVERNYLRRISYSLFAEKQTEIFTTTGRKVSGKYIILIQKKPPTYLALKEDFEKQVKL